MVRFAATLLLCMAFVAHPACAQQASPPPDVSEIAAQGAQWQSDPNSVLSADESAAFAQQATRPEAADPGADVSVTEAADTIVRHAHAILANPEVLAAEDVRPVQEQGQAAMAQYDQEARAIAAAGAEQVTSGAATAAIESIAPGTDALARTLLAKEAQEDGPPPPSVRYRIFVSQSMPATEVKALAQLTVDRPDAILVVRGLKPGQKFDDLLAWLMRMIGPVVEGVPVPSITIDPAQFTALAVTQVPVLARYDASGGAEGSVAGVTNLQWLDDRLDGGAHGAQGQFGPTSPVVEQDMAVMMQQTAARLDWEGMRDAALKKFFGTNVPRYPLPVVDSPRTRLVDPSFVAQSSFQLPDGRYVWREGERINPLEQVDFNEVIVVIDPADADQIAFAQGAMRRYGDHPVKLIASDLSSVGDFDGYGRLVERVGSRVYMLPQSLKDLFRIERVPTVIFARDGQFVVQEFPPVEHKEASRHADSRAHNR